MNSLNARKLHSQFVLVRFHSDFHLCVIDWERLPVQRSQLVHVVKCSTW